MEEHELDTPKIHRLVTLFGKVEVLLGRSVDLSMLQTLDALYIEARYPGELGLLPHGRPSAADAERFSIFANAVFQTAAVRLNQL
ncbi:MAG: HEPN domain-containing protein [Proteobacteria bacterium]|nr:HEPN domain-containing protein [Pseudomonadota bacterium]MDP2107190.1 hypothetical protein [Desulfobulbaceae bacterium]